MRTTMLCIAMLELVLCALDASPVDAANDTKGRTWCIDWNGQADEDGGTLRFRFTVKTGDQEQPQGMDRTVQPRETGEEKAEGWEAEMRRRGHDRIVEITRSGRITCITLLDSAPYDDITGLEVIENTTGEKVRTWDDVRQQTFLERVTYNLTGAAASEEATAVLGVGTKDDADRLVAVPTADRTGEQIERDLVAAFNKEFAADGYEASINDAGEIEIPNIPCTAGVSAGTDDSGLSWRLSLADEPGQTIPPSEDTGNLLWLWILIGLVLVVVVLYEVRRMRTSSV